MPKRNANADDAVFCVSLTTYLSSKIEAEAEFDRLQSVATDRSVELYEWSDGDQEWFEADSFTDPKKEERQ